MGLKTKKIDSFTQHYIEGLLLSDGSMSCNNIYDPKNGARYSQACICLSWLEEIAKVLNNSGLKATIVSEPRDVGKPIWRLYTNYCEALRPIYNRWYHGSKQVPRDIEFTPTLLRNWYLGDGSSCRSGANLYAEGFTVDCVEFLTQKLSLYLESPVTHTKNNNIFLPVSTRIKFIDLILQANTVPANMEHKFIFNADMVQPNKAVLFGVSGKKRHGKDTTFNILSELHSDKNFYKLALADPLKEETSRMLANTYVNYDIDSLAWVEIYKKIRLEMDLDETKEEYRGINAWWGTEFRRNKFSQTYWTDRLYHRIQQLLGSKCYIGCTDLRFPNEMQLIKDLGGKTIRINNPRIPILPNEHISETALDDYDGFDYVITNDGTLEDLKNKIKELQL